MGETLTREALYDLIWSQPISSLVSRFGVSDVAIRKTCDSAKIPVPVRGYWNKSPDQRPKRIPLPLREPGMSMDVGVGEGHRRSFAQRSEQEDLLAPVFNEPIEEVRARIKKRVGAVNVSAHSRLWHRAIQRLLKLDEKKRQEKAAGISWSSTTFDSDFQRRRLRLLSAIFIATEPFGCKPRISGYEAHEIELFINKTVFPIELDRPRNHRREVEVGADGNKEALRLSVMQYYGPRNVLMAWRDETDRPLEAQLTDIVVKILGGAEEQYRESCLLGYRELIGYRAKIAADREAARIAQLKEHQEKIDRLDRERIARLFADIDDLEKSDRIREYVKSIAAETASPIAVGSAVFSEWQEWALRQADRIDPRLDRKFLRSMIDPAPEEE